MAYYNSKEYSNLGNKRAFLKQKIDFSNAKDIKKLKNLWQYHFDTLPMPNNQQQLTQAKQQVIDNLPVTESTTYGFFPLFHHSSQSNGEYSNRYLLLVGNSKYSREYKYNNDEITDWDICSWVLGKYNHILYNLNSCWLSKM